jgi:hypothetical protein
MATVTTIPTNEWFAEASTGVVHLEFVDGDGVAIDSSAISAITAELVDDLGAIVNSRDTQDVKNTNGGTLSAGGIFDLEVSPTDTAARAAGWEYQPRYLTIVVTHSGGKTLVHEVRHGVRKIHGHGVT